MQISFLIEKDMITSRFLKQKNRSWQQKYQKHIPIEKISTTHDMSI